MGRKIQIILGFLLCVVLIASPSFAQRQKRKAAAAKKSKEEKLVRLVKGKSVELVEINGRECRRAIGATFVHNGTTLVCDTAIWDTERKIINAWGHVKLAQGDVTLTSDKLDYYIDRNTAEFRGSLVQLIDKKKNTLRTENLDYNTKDSTAVFRGGGAMKGSDGQAMEGVEGDYDAKEKRFSFNSRVNMYTDSVFVKSEQLDYYSSSKKAFFNTDVDFWKEDNMLSAQRGWYMRSDELFYFEGHVHIQSKEQEAWCDSMYYYRKPNDVLLLGNAQMQDTTRNLTAIARHIFYKDEIKHLTLREDAAVAIKTKHDEKEDTLFCGADTLIYYTVKKKDIPEDEFKAALSRLEDLNADPVTTYRRKAAEEAAKQKDEKLKQLEQEGQLPMSPGNARMGNPKAPQAPPAKEAPEEPEKAPKEAPEKAVEKAPADSILAAVADTTLAAVADTALASAAPEPEAASEPDTPAASLAEASPADTTLTAPTDSIPAMEDPDKDIGFAYGIGNVRMFREDMQMRCDSLRYNDLDSVARFYKEPIVWNEGNKQYTADSLYALIHDGAMDRASLLSNAMVISQEDTVYYDQISATEIMAYFNRDSQLKRFDALGGASALFYLEENDKLATVNRVDAKMLSANLVNGEVDNVNYFDNTKNDAYPLVQFPRTEYYMKGFNWSPEIRPMRREDVTTLKVRRTERDYYSSKPRTNFEFTEKYFPGYMASVYKMLEKKRFERQVREAEKKEQSVEVSETPVDTTEVAVVQDSLQLSDSTAVVRDSLQLADSLATDRSSAVVDSLMNRPKEPSAWEKKKQQWKLKREEREARRNARWDELDKIEAEQKAAKEAKKLEKKRARTRDLLLMQMDEADKDSLRLQKYIQKLEKKKERQTMRTLRCQAVKAWLRVTLGIKPKKVKITPEPDGKDN